MTSKRKGSAGKRSRGSEDWTVGRVDCARARDLPDWPWMGARSRMIRVGVKGKACDSLQSRYLKSKRWRKRRGEDGLQAGQSSRERRLERHDLLRRCRALRGQYMSTVSQMRAKSFVVLTGRMNRDDRVKVVLGRCQDGSECPRGSGQPPDAKQDWSPLDQPILLLTRHLIPLWDDKALCVSETVKWKD